MDESETLEKQRFLRKKILNKGYPASHFVGYLSEKRDDGDNLDNWSMEELKEVVHSYLIDNPSPEDLANDNEDQDGSSSEEYEQNSEGPDRNDDDEEDVERSALEDSRRFDQLEMAKEPGDETEDPEAEEDPQDADQDRVEDEDDDDDKIVGYNNDESLTEEERTIRRLDNKARSEKADLVNFDEQFKTVKRGSDELTDISNLKVKVFDPEEVKTGLFSRNYIAYKVETKAVDSLVLRRYSDFLWLHDILIKEYPGHYVAPIAEKSINKNFEEDFITQRMSTLQKFMDYIVQDVDLRSSIYVLSFLKHKDSKQFQKVKSELEKSGQNISNFRAAPLQKITNVKIEDFSNISCMVRTRIDPNLKHYTNALTDLQTELNDGIINLNRAIEKMALDCSTLALSINEVRNCFTSLSKIHEEFNKVSPYSVTKSNQTIYSSLGGSFGTMAAEMNSQAQILKTLVIPEFDYSLKEIKALNELLIVRNETGGDFFNSWLDLDTKKERLFAQGISNSWGIDPVKAPVPERVLSSNKNIAKYIMLPKESKLLKKKAKIFGYFNNQLYLQSKQVFECRSRRYIETLTELCNFFMQSYEEQNGAYQDLSNEFCDLFANLPQIQRIGFTKKSDQSKKIDRTDSNVSSYEGFSNVKK